MGDAPTSRCSGSTPTAPTPGAQASHATAALLHGEGSRLATRSREKRDRWVYPGTSPRPEGTTRPPRRGSRGSKARRGLITYADLVCGEMSTPANTLQDQVPCAPTACRSTTSARWSTTITMGITLVARGKDHLINTPPQVVLYPRSGRTCPSSRTDDADARARRCRSARRPAGIDVPVGNYREKGWLPEALLNYIARFGWSHGDQEVFSPRRFRRALRLEARRQHRREVRREEGRLGERRAPARAPDAELAAGVVPLPREARARGVGR